MKKTTNKIQELYMLTKAHLEALEDKQKELERQYILDNGIINPDGSIPNYIYCIEDEEVFNKANEEQAATTEASGLWQEILAARANLTTAEAKLIEYGLSIIPAKDRETLKKAVKENYTTHQKVIDMVLKLDVSTVK